MRAGKVLEVLAKPFATVELGAKHFDDKPVLMAVNQKREPGQS